MIGQSPTGNEFAGAFPGSRLQRARFHHQTNGKIEKSILGGSFLGVIDNNYIERSFRLGQL